jgi:hypothetical protein
MVKARARRLVKMTTMSRLGRRYNNDPKYLSTYCGGPSFILNRTVPVTTHHVAKWIIALRKHYGDGYRFEAEQIYEGGIEFSGWPGKTIFEFKTFRLSAGIRNWPHINDGSTTPAQWLAKDASTLYDGDSVITRRRDGTWKTDRTKFELTTCLKSFYGAPLWTLDEIDVFVKTFRESYEGVVDVQCMPKLKDLHTLRSHIGGE